MGRFILYAILGRNGVMKTIISSLPLFSCCSWFTRQWRRKWQDRSKVLLWIIEYSVVTLLTSIQCHIILLLDLSIVYINCEPVAWKKRSQRIKIFEKNKRYFPSTNWPKSLLQWTKNWQLYDFLKPSKDILLRGIRQQVSAKAVWPLQNVEEDVADLSKVERQLHMSCSSSKLLINICSEQKLHNSPPKKDGNSITALSNMKTSVEINSNDLYI